MSTKIKTVYLLRDGGTHALAKPEVWIESSAKGVIVYGVKVHARTIGQARERAESEFRALRRFAQRMEGEAARRVNERVIRDLRASGLNPVKAAEAGAEV